MFDGYHLAYVSFAHCLPYIISALQYKKKNMILAHLSRRLTRWAYWKGLELASVCASVYISETSGPVAIKLYLNHHWCGGKAAIGFGPDRSGTLVSLATDSFHRVITLAPSFLIGSSSYWQVTWATLISRMSSNFSQIRKSAALEHQKTSHKLIMGEKLLALYLLHFFLDLLHFYG